MKTAVLLLVLACLVTAGTIEATIEFLPGQVNFVERNGFTLVELDVQQEGLVGSWTGEPGLPLLPVVSGNVLIPAGSDVVAVKVTPCDRQELGTGLLIHPAQPVRTFTELDAGSCEFIEPDRRVYSSDDVFPAQPLTRVPAGTKAGFRLAGFVYCPFEYRPASGRLVLVTRAKVSVSFRENALDAPVLTPNQFALAAEDVSRLVLNRKDIGRYGPHTTAKFGRETDVVVFTNSTLAPALAGIRSWLERKGYFTDIVVTDTVSQPGRDRFEKMRNLVKHKFAEQGLKYVILAGDVEQCSLRYAWLPSTTFYVPADMYFADLDGSWDANNNSKFGEMEGDSVDLFHDVYVGRLPLDSAPDAANFLAKDTTYELTPDTAYLNNALLAHEIMWANIGYHGGFTSHNIARTLVGSSSWEIDSGMDIGPGRVTDGLNAGRHFFHFAGHGQNDQFGSTYSSAYLRFLANAAKPCIVNSVACFTGCFDMPPGDCIGEKMMNLQTGGSVATMLPARYGWGAPPCLGPNETFDCILFGNYLTGMTLGRAHGLTKDFLRNLSLSQMPMRYANYTNTLLGDPTMTLWRRPPTALAVTCPDTIPATPQVLPVQVNSTNGPVKDARVAILHSGELLARSVTNAQGSGHVPVSGLENGWTLDLYVSGQDCQMYQTRIAVGTGAGAALPVFKRSRVADPNGRLDPSEESDLYLVIENRGSAQIDSLVGTLVSLSPYATVTRATAFYGLIPAGDTATGTAYRVSVSPACPHGLRAGFELTLSSGPHEWRADFELPVGLPYARAGLWAVLDTGDYCLAVCANGGIGTTSYHGEGIGFIYPKTRKFSSSALMHASLILGTDSTWVCDNYYGAPDWTVCCEDFSLAESVRPVLPPKLGDKQFVTRFTDAAHPAPKGLSISHSAYGSARPTHKDFVILEYRIRNSSANHISNLYAAVACDFRTPGWNVNDSFDYAGTDSLRNIAYVKSADSGETLALGIRHIYPNQTTGFANCLNDWTWVANGFTKAEKMGFMNGTLRSTNGPTPGNWSAMSSSGPYSLAAGDSQIVAFALCGARTVAELLTISDTAAAWYNPAGGNAGEQTIRPEHGLQVFPHIFSRGIHISYSLDRPGRLEILACDASGRVVTTYRHFASARTGRFFWQPQLAPGVYFLRCGQNAAKILKVH
ncbi:MAG: C25 family cysteine peptidase [candidate division WOR-3 bacterium]